MVSYISLVFVLIQVLILNNILFLAGSLPVSVSVPIVKDAGQWLTDASRFLLFHGGVVIDTFSNTPGMHAADCTLAGFCREPLIRVFMGKDLPDGIYPSYKTFGFGGFFRYVLSFVLIQHTTLSRLSR